MASSFFWYELMTSDAAAAEAFYRGVVGWNSEAFGGSGMEYLVMKAGERGVAGIMKLPQGAPMPPCWVGYIHATDVDAKTEQVRLAGGTVHRAPEEIPGVGRFSVVADPQGAMFMLLQPYGEDQSQEPRSKPGQIGWHELYADDADAVLGFYASEFGWSGGDALDMGEMGTYRTFHDGQAEAVGGMMNRPPHLPAPAWLFYFSVDDVQAAADRVAALGGQVLMGPIEVPGGSLIVHARDPQGVWFALVARPDAAATMVPAKAATKRKSTASAKAETAKPPRKASAKKATHKK